MAWVIRGGRAYQYRTTRQGGKVVCRYEAALPAADIPLLRSLDAERRSLREMGRADREAERGRLADAERRIVEADAAYDGLATAALVAAGFHRPKRDRWRRRRTMTRKIDMKPTGPPVMGEAGLQDLFDRIDRAEGDQRQALAAEAVDAVQSLLERARDGDDRALPALRLMVARRPNYFGKLGIGDFAAKALAISSAGSKDVFLREVHIKEIERVRDELAGPAPTPLERLLCERVALAWFDANQRDYAGLAATSRGCGLDEAEYHSRQRTRASARFLAAAKSLATVRRLALPVLHLHKDANPPAPAGAATDCLRVLAGDAS